MWSNEHTDFVERKTERLNDTAKRKDDDRKIIKNDYLFRVQAASASASFVRQNLFRSTRIAQWDPISVCDDSLSLVCVCLCLSVRSPSARTHTQHKEYGRLKANVER